MGYLAERFNTLVEEGLLIDNELMTKSSRNKELIDLIRMSKQSNKDITGENLRDYISELMSVDYYSTLLFKDYEVTVSLIKELYLIAQASEVDLNLEGEKENYVNSIIKSTNQLFTNKNGKIEIKDEDIKARIDEAMSKKLSSEELDRILHSPIFKAS